jgi:hypothetical protein
MRAGAEHVQHRDQIVDVVVEIEAALGERHHARIRPVGDVDVVAGQHRVDGAAEQRRVMARHRRDDQELLLVGRLVAAGLLEIEELAEGPLPDDALMDREALAMDEGRGQPEFRLAVAACRALEKFRRGGHVATEGGMRQRIQRVLEVEAGCVGGSPKRAQGCMVQFIELVVGQAPNPLLL